jgi:hypothetical protein
MQENLYERGYIKGVAYTCQAIYTGKHDTARDFEHIQYSDVEGLCGSVGLYGPKRLAILAWVSEGIGSFGAENP